MSEELNTLQHAEIAPLDRVSEDSHFPTINESADFSAEMDQLSNANLEKMLSLLKKEQTKRQRGKKKALEEIARLCEKHEIGKHELLAVLKQQ